MKRLTNQIVSLMLVASMICSMGVTAFAASPKVEPTENYSVYEMPIAEAVHNQYEALSLKEGTVNVSVISEDITLVTEDYENGNVVVKQIEKGKITDTIFVDRQTNTIKSIGVEQGEKVEIEQVYNPIEKQEAYKAPDYTYVGAIEYRCIPISYTSEVTRLLHLGYMSKYEPNAKYDLYGEYKTLAFLVSVVCGIFNLPGAIASKAVQWVLGALGIAATFAPVVIPQNTILNCQKTSYHWRLQDDEDSSRYTMFTGDRYIITEDTAGKKEYVDDFFYVPASYRNRDNAYALKMFRLLYGDMKSVKVSAWKPA